jgi:hypothetical protein
VLVLAPAAWRVPASLATALLAITAMLTLRSRAYGIDRALMVRLRGLWGHRHEAGRRV